MRLLKDILNEALIKRGTKIENKISEQVYLVFAFYADYKFLEKTNYKFVTQHNGGPMHKVWLIPYEEMKKIILRFIDTQTKFYLLPENMTSDEFKKLFRNGDIKVKQTKYNSYYIDSLKEIKIKDIIK